ncbi:hypothetical protein BT63DRAFT_428177 [Microthyrium microscopicum]|uniref:Uncharacterized protein n=1 Tax=Microthyrium microscopicum TaxID=703497 RepID=A0A6A6U4N3_9PEZI|nr:hypothetical protein BT63DRAFT_428177 [Microthyrium microscopicum]
MQFKTSLFSLLALVSFTSISFASPVANPSPQVGGTCFDDGDCILVSPKVYLASIDTVLTLR